MRPQNGETYFFPSRQFHYQTLRAIGHEVYQGAALGEVLTVIQNIQDSNEESWFQGWEVMARKCEQWSGDAGDPITRGHLLLRASNYHRASIFFLHPSDPRCLETYMESVQTFQDALKCLAIPHHIFYVPYEKGKMRLYYFPGRSDRPLVMVCGGYDSTNEESYFFAGAALIARGYPVLMYEGPGQSSMLREYGIKFTADWHKPVGKIIDFIVAQDPELEKRTKILFGISFGDILVGRAAAHESRIDGVVLFGGPYDMFETAFHQMPPIGRSIYQRGHKGLLNRLVNLKKRRSIALRWGVNNGLYTIGGDSPFELFTQFSKYTLKDVHEKITCPVLNMYGENDLFVSDGVQDKLFMKAFPNSRLYTLKVFTKEMGSAEHCQIGAIEQAIHAFETWLVESKLLSKL